MLLLSDGQIVLPLLQNSSLYIYSKQMKTHKFTKRLQKKGCAKKLNSKTGCVFKTTCKYWFVISFQKQMQLDNKNILYIPSARKIIKLLIITALYHQNQLSTCLLFKHLKNYFIQCLSYSFCIGWWIHYTLYSTELISSKAETNYFKQCLPFLYIPAERL